MAICDWLLNYGGIQGLMDSLPKMPAVHKGMVLLYENGKLYISFLCEAKAQQVEETPEAKYFCTFEGKGSIRIFISLFSSFFISPFPSHTHTFIQQVLYSPHSSNGNLVLKSVTILWPSRCPNLLLLYRIIYAVGFINLSDFPAQFSWFHFPVCDLSPLSWFSSEQSVAKSSAHALSHFLILKGLTLFM